MKHRVLLLFIFTFGLMLPLLASLTSLPPLIPFREGEKWGYCNAQKEIKIPCKYIDAYPFSHGYGLVQDDAGKWHLVNSKGKVGKGIDVESISILSPTLMVVFKNDKFGLMNTKGKALTECKYEEFINFYGTATATWAKRNGSYGILNKKGKEVLPAEYAMVSGPDNGTFAVKKGEKYAIYNEKGKALSGFVYDAVNLLSDDVFTVKEGESWKIIDKNLQLILNLGEKYSFVGNFENGLCRASAQGLWGLINLKGEEVIPVKYNSAGMLGEGLFSHREGGFDIITDKTGNIIRKDIEYVSSFVNHRALINQNGKSGMISPDGKTIIPCKYDRISDFFIGDYTTAERNNQDIILDIKGNELFSGDFESIDADESDLFMISGENGKVGYIDTKGTQYWKE